MVIRDQSGQALTEFAACSIFLSLGLVLCGTLLLQHWRQFQCAFTAFEETRARLYGGTVSRKAVSVAITENADSIEGFAVCGSRTERVKLYRLESRR